jgi:hypothetical protein
MIHTYAPQHIAMQKHFSLLPNLQTIKLQIELITNLTISILDITHVFYFKQRILFTNFLG